MGLRLSTKMGGRISTGFDGDALMGEILQTGDKVIKGASTVMKDEGEEIRDLARDNAPYDEGYLETAIKTEATIGKGRRTEVRVYVDGSMPGSGGRAGEQRPVGAYAWLMHELLGPYGAGVYQPGERTMTKRAAGFKAGGRYLERAFKERLKTLMSRITAGARKGFRR